MTIEEPAVSPTGRYTRKQTCQILQISPGTLDNWRIKGALMPYYRKGNGRPYYLGKDIKRAWIESF